MYYKYSAKDIVRLLEQDIDRTVRYLLPNGKRQGNEWCVGSINGELGNSLKVCLSGNKLGVWSDFATGAKGDLLNLWCACRNLEIREAILEVNAWLGISNPKFEPQRRSNWSKPQFKPGALLSSSSPSYYYLTEERKLTLSTLTKFRITEEGNDIVFPYYQHEEITLVKYLKLERPDGKKMMRVSPNCEPCLFGWQAVSTQTRSIVLVEGEIDAMSLDQYGLGLGVLSVPFGGGNGDKHRWLENEFDNLAIYDEIFLCFDNDQVGQSATNELVQRLGRHRCRIVHLPYKDANECLQNDISVEDIQTCFTNARILDPDELKRASIYVEQVIQELYPTDNQHLGYELPWEKTRGKIYFRTDELSIWTGINGHGKSQVIGQIILHSMKQGARICVASLELKPKRLLARLTRQASGLRNPTEEYIRAIHDWYDDKLWLFDLVGTAKTERLLEVLQYAKQRYGINMFIIDSLMKCGISEDDYNAQKLFIEKLCDFKNEYNCHIHLVVHPRKGVDELKMPGKLDMKGSGSITDLADNCFTVWRNKHKEDQISRVRFGDNIPA